MELLAGLFHLKIQQANGKICLPEKKYMLQEWLGF